MIIYFEKEKNHMIVAPYKCGSQYLNMNKEAFNLEIYTMPDIVDFSAYLDEDNAFNTMRKKVLRKTYLFKSSIERYLSFINTLVVTAETRDAYFWEVAYKYATENLNVYSDWHIIPHNFYFDTSKENMDEYDFIDSAKDYSKWIYLTFGVKTPSYQNMMRIVPVQGLNFYYAMKTFQILEETYSCEKIFQNKILHLNPL
jgi:hypothetical protein